MAESVITIRADGDQAKAELKSVQSSLAGMGGAAKGAGKDAGSATPVWSRAAVAFTALGGAVTAAKAAYSAIRGAIVGTTGEALAQIDVMARVRNSVERAGVSWSESGQAIEDFFRRQQEVTRFGDDETAAMMGRLAESTAALRPTAGTLISLTALAQDMAEALGGAEGASEAMSLLSKAAGGNVETLGRVLPAYRDQFREIGKLPDAASRASAAIALLTGHFAGAAEKVDPLIQAFAELNSGAGDMREAFGQLLLKSESFTSAIRLARRFMLALEQSFLDTAESGSGMGEAVGAAMQAIIRVAAPATAAILSMGAAVGALSDSFEAVLELGRAGDIMNLRRTIGTILAGGEIGRAEEAMTRMRLSMQQIPEEAQRAIREAISVSRRSGAQLGSLAPELEGILSGLADVHTSAADSAGRAWDEMTGNFLQSMERIAAVATLDVELPELERPEQEVSFGGTEAIDAQTEAVAALTEVYVDGLLPAMQEQFSIAELLAQGGTVAKMAEIDMATKLAAAEQARFDQLVGARQIQIELGEKLAAQQAEELARTEGMAQTYQSYGDKVGSALSRVAAGQTTVAEAARGVVADELRAAASAGLYRAGLLAFTPGGQAAAVGLTAASIAGYVAAGLIERGGSPRPGGGGAVGAGASAPSAAAAPSRQVNVSIVSNFGLVGDPRGAARLVADQVRLAQREGLL